MLWLPIAIDPPTPRSKVVGPTLVGDGSECPLGDTALHRYGHVSHLTVISHVAHPDVAAGPSDEFVAVISENLHDISAGEIGRDRHAYCMNSGRSLGSPATAASVSTQPSARWVMRPPPRPAAIRDDATLEAGVGSSRWTTLR